MRGFQIVKGHSMEIGGWFCYIGIFSCQYTNGMGLQLLLPFFEIVYLLLHAAYRHSMPCTRFVVDVIVLCCLVLFHLIPVIMNCSLLLYYYNYYFLFFALFTTVLLLYIIIIYYYYFYYYYIIIINK